MTQHDGGMRLVAIICALLAAGPLVAQTSFRGIYVGTVFVAGQRTDSVMLVNVIKNDTAAGLVYDYLNREFIEAPNVPIDAEGRFTVKSGNVIFNGRIQNDQLSATSNTGATAAGLKAPLNGSAQAFAGSYPGWLVTPTAIRDHGMIITADGWIYTYARTSATTAEGAVGRINAAGEFTLSFVGGTTAAGKVTPIGGTPTLTGFYQRGSTFYDMIGGRESANNDLVNISTRGFVGTGSSVMIAGFIIQPSAKRVFIRALGPTLGAFGVADALADPQLELYKGSTLLLANDDWQTAPDASQINLRPDKPTDPKEPALLVSLEPGAYTVILKGKGTGTGNALIEVNQVE